MGASSMVGVGGRRWRGEGEERTESVVDWGWCVLVRAPQVTTSSLEEAVDREKAAEMLASSLAAQLKQAKEQCEVGRTGQGVGCAVCMPAAAGMTVRFVM